MLWWAIRSQGSRNLLLRWFENDRRPDELIVRFDPSLTKTVDLALGQGLIDRTSSGAHRLTARGLSLAESVLEDSTALTDERAFLDALPGRITQRHVQTILEWN